MKAQRWPENKSVHRNKIRFETLSSMLEDYKIWALCVYPVSIFDFVSYDSFHFRLLF